MLNCPNREKEFVVSTFGANISAQVSDEWSASRLSAKCQEVKID